MKRRLLLLFFCVLLTACGTHYYRINENDMIFILKRSKAKKVALFCSLDGFKPRMAQKVSGRWEVKLPADEVFRYFYQVDDMLFLPDCQMKEMDDFGSTNCIFDPHL